MAPQRKTEAALIREYADELAKRDADLIDARRAIKQLRKATEEAEAVAEEIRRRIDYKPTIPDWVNSKTSKLTDHGAPLTILSDVHYGEVVKAAQTNGVNDYNPAIAYKRLKTYTSHVIEIQRQHGGSKKPPGLVLCLGGDMISGSIQEELRMTDAKTPIQDVQEMTDALAGVVDNLSTYFGRLFMPCVVGNHGRDTLKTHFKNAVFHNHDWSLYMNLARVFKGNKNIRFYIPEAFD